MASKYFIAALYFFTFIIVSLSWITVDGEEYGLSRRENESV